MLLILKLKRIPNVSGTTKKGEKDRSRKENHDKAGKWSRIEDENLNLNHLTKLRIFNYWEMLQKVLVSHQIR